MSKNTVQRSCLLKAKMELELVSLPGSCSQVEIMAELMKSSVFSTLFSSGSIMKYHLDSSFNCMYRICFNFDAKPDKRVFSVHSMSKVYSLRMKESFVGSYACTDVMLGYVSDGEEEEVVISEREELGGNFDGEHSADLGIYEEFDLGCTEVDDGSSGSRGIENGMHFLEETDEEVLSERILVLSRRNKIRSAMEYYNSMNSAGLFPNVHACNSLLSCLLRNGRFDDALRVFERMEINGIASGHTYSLVLKAVANAQGYDSSLRMFMELKEKCSANKVFDAVVYNTMISICGRMHDWSQCEKIWMSMKENGHVGTEVTYSLLVTIFVRCGQNELALDAYNEMVENGLKPGGDVSQAILKACTKEGNWNLALRIFQSMLNRGVKPNLVACNALMNSLGKAGEVSLAFKVYNIIKSLGLLPDAYTLNGLLSALYRANRPADALRLFDNIIKEQGSEQNLHLYNTALMSCSKLGAWDKAIQILWQMEASGLSLSAASYNLVLNACEIARKPKVALQVYEHMIHQKCLPDTFTHLSLIRSCIWGCLWIEVEDILKWVPADVSSYNAAIQGMCLRGKFDLAKKIYMQMREKGLKPDGKTRALMLQTLPKK